MNLVTISTAMVVGAIVAFTVMVMVITPDIGVIAQIACQQICNRCVCITTAAAVEGDACLLECHLCTAADAAANQHIRMQTGEESCQCAMAAAVGVHHFRGHNRTVFHFVYLELLCVGTFRGRPVRGGHSR